VNFSGWVQLRRGLIEHLHDGRLTVMEFSVLVVLIMLASKDSGSGTINANTLAAFMGEGLNYESDVLRNRQRGKQRVLHNLEAKRYIYRQIVPHSKRAYRYWVDKYELTGGPHKSRRLDLSKVFETRDVADIRYSVVACEGVVDSVAESVAHTVVDPVTSNKKEKENYKNKEIKPSIKNSESASVRASAEETTLPQAITQAQHTVQRASALPSAPPSNDGITQLCAALSAPQIRPPKPTAVTGWLDTATVFKRGIEDRTLAFDAGLRIGNDGVWEDMERDCMAVTKNEAYQRLMQQISKRNASPHRNAPENVEAPQ
jgi:hypothetical protein